MILTKYVEIKVCTSNLEHFINLGYTNLVTNQRITIPVEHLMQFSDKKVLVKCDVCGNEKMLSYGNYMMNFRKGNIYCCSVKCSEEKRKKGNLEKYGVEFTLQDKNIREKMKKTCLEKYGNEHHFQNEDIKKKIEKTMLKKYGVKNPIQNKEIKEKIKKTCLEKYGFENPLYNEKVIKKRNDTNLKKFGTKSPIQNHGVYEKIKKTCLKRYGVEYSMQSFDIHQKQQLSGFLIKIHEETGLYYRGTYEKDFLDFCFQNNIEILQGKTIKYFFNEKNRIYFSDFYLKDKNLIIEIKSSYTYKRSLDKNIAKQNSCLQQGYSFIFIINKNYNELKLLLEME